MLKTKRGMRMACKHEGGTDPCDERSGNSCAAWARRYEAIHRPPGSRLTGQERGRSTAAGELLVQADLSRRGYEVTVPVSPTALHDLHVELPSVGWRGVQVKVGRLNLRTNVISMRSSKAKVRSPILALVHPPTGTIHYRRGTTRVPKELT